MKILGIETSCDDTSIAIIEEGSPLPKILSHRSFSQETILKEWGGVIPEIAARNHLAKLVPLLKECFAEAALVPTDIDLIGVTTYPGLLGPLLTGLNAAKSLSLLHGLPLIPVNHLFAHLEAIFLVEEIQYPYLGLLVSGGHSMYLLAHSKNSFELLGTTIDDAAGEAFDKGGKLLGLGYPAGRLIDQLSKEGDLTKFSFPIGLKDSKDTTLSFSGVKTQLRVLLDKIEKDWTESEHSQQLKDICAAYQESIIDALLLKLKFALAIAKEKTGQDLPIVIGGGVACNGRLREKMKKSHPSSFFVPPKFCTDNGAMIANYALRTKEFAHPFPHCLEVDAKSRYFEKKEWKN